MSWGRLHGADPTPVQRNSAIRQLRRVLSSEDVREAERSERRKRTYFLTRLQYCRVCSDNAQISTCPAVAESRKSAVGAAPRRLPASGRRAAADPQPHALKPVTR